MKTALWLLCAAPLLDLIARATGLLGSLGTNPQETILRSTGLWALVLLLVTLGVTPLRRLAHWVELLRVRRMLGLWVFAYAVIHFAAFWAFEHDFSMPAVMADSLKRPFVTVGLLSFLALLPLAMTSNAAAMRWLGPRWKKLHRLVYVIAVLACVQFFLHRVGKNNLLDPFLASTVLAVWFALRVWWAWKTRPIAH